MAYVALAIDKMVNYNSRRLSLARRIVRLSGHTFDRHNFSFTVELCRDGSDDHGPRLRLGDRADREMLSAS